MKTIETDYLVIGAGTTGLAFADTLISQGDAHVTIVDRRGKPGGHWNDACFDRVMQHTLLPSGRVSYHPMCNMLDDGRPDLRFECLLSGEQVQVKVRRKIVDAHAMSPSIPATHEPRFRVEPGAALVPPNALSGLWHGAGGGAGAPLPRNFVVIGAGKTAMDTCIWLLGAGAPASAIIWVKPREAWLVNRITTQPAAEFFFDAIGGQADQMAAFGAVTALQTLDQIVRLGHVCTIAPGRMQLDEGEVAVPPDALFIDCTASAVEPRPSQPIFQDGRIVLQMVRLPQPAFSAAVIAYVEAHDDAYPDTASKNAICATVPFPYQLADYPRAVAVGMQNQYRWGQEKALRQWMRESRLDGFGRLMSSVDPQDADKQAVLARYKAGAMAAMANLPRLMGRAA